MSTGNIRRRRRENDRRNGRDFQKSFHIATRPGRRVRPDHPVRLVHSARKPLVSLIRSGMLATTRRPVGMRL